MNAPAIIELPRSLLARRWQAVWWRNLRVWQRLLGPAILSNFGEPLLYLLGLGYGLGFFVGEVGGMSYMAFLASGILCSSAMQTASFEGMYSAYTRMAVQRTWQGMLATPLELEDILWGEVLWAASKSLFCVAPILLVAALLGAVDGGWTALWVLLVIFLGNLCFAALALVMTALAQHYDFFLYYTSLLLTPMTLLSGVFFPLDSLPPAVQFAAYLLPLAHTVDLARPLMTGQPPADVLWHVAVLLLYLALGIALANRLLAQRFRQ